MKRRVEPQLFGEDRQFLFDEIEAVERTLDCPFTDNARHELAIYLQVMTLRIRRARASRARHRHPARVCRHAGHRKTLRHNLGIRREGRCHRAVLGCRAPLDADFQDTYTPDRESAHLADDLFLARSPTDTGRARVPPCANPSPCSSRQTHRKLDPAIALPPEISWTVRFENITLFMRLAQLMRDTPSLSSVDLYETDHAHRHAVARFHGRHRGERHLARRPRGELRRRAGAVRARPHRALPAIHPHRPCDSRKRRGRWEHRARRTGLPHFNRRPIETALPVAVISSAITELDRRYINDTILAIAQHRAQGDGPVDDDLPVRELPRWRANRSDALHRALTAESLWAGTDEEFRKIFEMCSLTCAPRLSSRISLQGGTHGSALFSIDAQIPFRRTRLTHAAVLAASTSARARAGRSPRPSAASWQRPGPPPRSCNAHREDAWHATCQASFHVSSQAQKRERVGGIRPPRPSRPP